MSGPNYDRAIEQLEEELWRDDLSDEDRKWIRREMRAIAEEAAEEESWRELGLERGWYP